MALAVVVVVAVTLVVVAVELQQVAIAELVVAVVEQVTLQEQIQQLLMEAVKHQGIVLTPIYPQELLLEAELLQKVEMAIL